jgi:hypothetical protein
MKKALPRRARGISAVETAIAAFITIVAAAIGVDMTILTMGFNILDQATRDAARAAGSRQDSISAFQAAQTQLSIHQTDGVFIKQPVLLGSGAPAPGGSQPFVYQDFGGGPPVPANASPYVMVVCTEDIHLPINIPFFGDNMSSFANAGGYFTLKRNYVFPIVREKFH